MPPRESYDWLRAHAVETATIGSALALLHWDQSTKMPPAGHAHRTAQVGTLTKLLHERRTDPRVGEALDKARAELLREDPESEFTANVREWQRAYDRAVRIPTELAVATAGPPPKAKPPGSAPGRTATGRPFCRTWRRSCACGARRPRP
jgi:carboxypeptidase Taq